MAVNDVYQVSAFYHANDRQFITSFHYRETVEDTGPWPAAAITAAWGGALQVPFRDLLSGEAILGCLKCRRIVGGVGPTSVLYFVDAVGTRAGEAYPGSKAIQLNLYGLVHGRTSRGSQRISGFSETDYANVNFVPAYVTTEGGAYLTALTTDLVGIPPSTGEWEFGFMSRAPVVAGGPLVAYPGVFIKPSVLSFTPIASTIRSRQTTYTAARGA